MSDAVSSGHRRSLRDRGRIVVVLVTGLAATLVCWRVAENHRYAVYDAELENVAHTTALNLEVQTQKAGALVEALAGFFENSRDVSQEEFRAFVDRAAVKWPGVVAAAFQPHVHHADRAGFELAMRQAGQANFQILDVVSPGERVPAAERESYFPITHLSTIRGRTPPIGVDLQVFPQFMSPKWQALEWGRPASSRLLLFQSFDGSSESGQVGFVVNAAVLRPGSEPPRERLRGFVSASFLMAPLVQAAVDGVPVEGLQLRVADTSAIDGAVYVFPGSPSATAVVERPDPEIVLARIPGGSWSVRVAAGPDFARGALGWYPRLLLFGGIALTVGVAVVTDRRRQERRQRRRADEERRAAERKFHDVVTNMAGSVAVFGVDAAGSAFSVWDMNGAAALLTRDGCRDVMGRPLEEVFCPDLSAALREPLRRVWGTGRAEKLPPFALQRGGIQRWLTANVFKLGTGEIVTVCTDVTAQKEVEQELRQARTELEVALDASRVGLWSWDVGLARAHLDRRAASILDVGSTETLGEADLVDRIHADDAKALRVEAGAAIAAGREFEMEVRVAIRSGEWRRLCLRARAVGDATQKSGRKIVGCVWDGTRRHLLEENRQHWQRMDSVATLAGGIAHDLNNALAPMSMGLDLIRLRIGDDAEATETLLRMRDSVDKATAVVRQLSGLVQASSPDAGTTEPRRTLEALREQLEDTLPPGIAVRVVPPAVELPPVRAGARQLQQVLQSLCINAREAMRGSGALTVEARALSVGAAASGDFPELAPGSYVEFAVTDTGPGIPEHIRHRIFDPFFTTKGPGRGAGLGLPTALSLVRSLHGTIHFTSEAEVGTRFSLIVPAARAATPAKSAPVPVPAAPRPSSGSRLRGRRVLLADDDMMVREVARRVLESAGMTVVAVADGREAIEAVKREPQGFDLAVLDIVMPGVDGPTAALAIREVRTDLPLIGASGYTSHAVRDQVQAVGFTSFLPKPYTMDGLLDAVSSALKRPAAV